MGGFAGLEPAGQVWIVVEDQVPQCRQRAQVVVGQGQRAAACLLEVGDQTRGLGTARPRCIAEQEELALVQVRAETGCGVGILDTALCGDGIGACDGAKSPVPLVVASRVQTPAQAAVQVGLSGGWRRIEPERLLGVATFGDPGVEGR